MTYKRNNELLEEFSHFIYTEEIFLRYPKRWELFRSKTYKSKNIVNKKNEVTYDETKKCSIYRYWEMIAAPKEYLLAEGFIPVV